MESVDVQTMPDGFREAWVAYIGQIEANEHTLRSSGSRRMLRKNKTASRLGLQYLAIIANEHSLIFGNQEEQDAEQYFRCLIKKVQNVYLVSPYLLGLLVYQIYFSRNQTLQDNFVESIRGLLTQIKYNGIFPSGCVGLKNCPVKHSSSFCEGEDPDQNYQPNLVQVDGNQLANKLTLFCKSFSENNKSLGDSIDTYLNQLGSVKAEASQLCHQFGLSQPVYVKTQQGKMFQVTVKMDFSSKLTGLTSIVYQEVGLQRNAKLAILSATTKYLRKFYTTYPHLWQKFKNIKARKQIVT